MCDPLIPHRNGLFLKPVEYNVGLCVQEWTKNNHDHVLATCHGYHESLIIIMQKDLT